MIDSQLFSSVSEVISDGAVVEFANGLSPEQIDALRVLFKVRRLGEKSAVLWRRLPPRVGRVTVQNRVFVSAPPFPVPEFLAFYLFSHGVKVDSIADLLAPAVRASGEGFFDVKWLLEICYIAELERLVTAGLSKRYVYSSEVTGTINGRIDWNRSTWRPVPTCVRSDLTHDHPLNRMLLGVARDIVRLSGVANLLEDSIAGIEGRIQGLINWQSPSYDTLALALHTLPDRVAHYRQAIVLALALLAGRRARIDSGEAASPDLQYDIATIFEAFLHRLLLDGLEFAGTNVEVQLTDPTAFLDDRGDPYARVRPDFVLTKRGGRRLIVDAKFKRGYADASHKISTADLFQICFYCRRNASAYPAKGFIVAPLLSNDVAADVHVKHKGDGGDVDIEVLPLPLSAMLSALVRGDTNTFDRNARSTVDLLLKDLL